MSTVRRRAETSLRTLAVALVVLGMASGGWIAFTSGALGPVARGGVGEPAHIAAATSPASTFNPPCAYVTATVCVSLANPGEPNIIPAAGEFTSSVEPSNSTSLPLYVKSELPLNTSQAITSGPDSPVTLNVTGTLWNGDQYYNPYDGSIWHSGTAQYFIGPLPQSITGNNQTYPFWYEVNFTARNSAGHTAFFAGMSITWWIEITVNESGQYVHNESPRYHFTYAGAWPSSPYAGSTQYAGPAAFGQDITVRASPSQPNWNDSIDFTLRTTAADAPINATLHAAELSLSEVASNGTPIGSTVLQYTTNNSFGVIQAEIVVPASWSQDPNATVTYTIAALDAWGDQVVSAPASYEVGGNGSFATSFFSDELSLTASPNVTGLQNFSTPVVAPGTPVNLTVASRNPNVAINAAEVVYTVTLPEIASTTQQSFYLARENSTTFAGTIPGLPLDAQASFVVLAWDFSSHLVESAPAAYSVESFSTLVPTFASNATYANASFFYVGVYDQGGSRWVTGATVMITGQTGFLRSVGPTLDGLAYPNATGSPFTPLVVPAGAVYFVNVTYAGQSEQVAFTPTHGLGSHEVLASASTWSAVEEGNVLLFTFNATAPPSVAAPATPATQEIGAIAGLAAAAVVVIPLIAWWRRIQARREAELQRVTL